MSVKAILVLCAQALLIQSVFSQCGCGGNYGAGLPGYGVGPQILPAPPAAIPCGSGFGYGAGIGIGAGLGSGAGLGYGAGSGYGGLAIEVIPTSGGSLAVTSSSPIAPSSLSIASENVFEGALILSGELPFSSAVAVEGAFPSAGVGTVSHSCGNGVSIESIAPSAGAYAPGIAGYGSGVATIAPGSAAIAPGLGYGGIGNPGCGCGIYW